MGDTLRRSKMKSNSKQISSERLRLLTYNSIIPLWDICKLCVHMEKLKKNLKCLWTTRTFSHLQRAAQFFLSVPRSAKFESYRGQPSFQDTGKCLKEYVSHLTEGNEVSSVCIYKDFLNFRRYTCTEFLYPVNLENQHLSLWERGSVYLLLTMFFLFISDWKIPFPVLARSGMLPQKFWIRDGRRFQILFLFKETK